MRIIGPDGVVFGVANPNDCHTFLVDYGLHHSSGGAPGGIYEAKDGTSIILASEDDPALPPAMQSGSNLRQIIWGCEDQAAVDEIAAELSSDREVIVQDDGSIWSRDDLGFEIAFRVTQRRESVHPPELINTPGADAGRAINALGTEMDPDSLPLTLSHIVLFVPDLTKLENFYARRLGFVTTDRFTGVGPFMRAASQKDHHSLFCLQTPPHMQGIEHLAFHVQGPMAMLTAGTRFKNKGYETFWGPGRHIFGSNWFWYFNSPFGCHFEYDADMDQHDDAWEPREVAVNAEASQTFLFENVEKWMPGGGPPH